MTPTRPTQTIWRTRLRLMFASSSSAISTRPFASGPQQRALRGHEDGALQRMCLGVGGRAAVSHEAPRTIPTSPVWMASWRHWVRTAQAMQ